MSKSQDTKLMLTITESNGVSDELKRSYIELFEKSKYSILAEEGGPGTDEHYHLHGILSTRYKATNNFRRRVLKPMHKKLDKELTAWGVKIKEVKDVSGALSYVYKDKRILCHSGILLDTIIPWKSKTKTNIRLKEFKNVGKHNFVQELVKFIDAQGIKTPSTYLDVRNIISDMMENKYLFDFGNWTRSCIGKVLAVYGSREYSLSHLDFLCNFSC